MARYAFLPDTWVSSLWVLFYSRLILHLVGFVESSKAERINWFRFARAFVPSETAHFAGSYVVPGQPEKKTHRLDSRRVIIITIDITGKIGTIPSPFIFAGLTQFSPIREKRLTQRKDTPKCPILRMHFERK